MNRRRLAIAVVVAAAVLFLSPAVAAEPTAEFTYSPQEPWVGSEVEFNASETTAGGSNISIYEWRFGDGTIDNGETVTHTYEERGSYEVTLLVEDMEGSISEKSKTLNVEAKRVPEAVVEYEPEEPLAGETVTFDASGSEGEIEGYDWVLNGSSLSNDDATLEHVFDKEGEFDVVLTVTNDQGNSDNARETVTVEGNVEEVTPIAVINASVEQVEVGETVTFVSETILREGEIESYEWAVAGEEYTEENVSHTFEEAGEYTVSLTVTSDTGYEDSTNTTVTVTEADGGEETSNGGGEEDSNPLPGFGFFAVVVAFVGFAAVRIR
jgi:PKD repeat protein